MPSDRLETPFERLLTEPVRNGIYKKKEFHGRGAKIVNMGELFAHPRLRAVPMKKVALSESEANRFLLQKGDLLFARRSLVAEGAGKCSVVLDVDEPTTFESSIIRARPDSAKADSLYLYYFFNSRRGMYHLDTIRRQVAVAGITGGDLAKLEIPVPSLPEQRAIAHILGTLDDKIELNRRMSETLEAMARALFKSWFVDFDPVRAKAEGRDPGLPKEVADLFPSRLIESEIGEIPEGWRVRSLGNLCQYLNRGVSPAYTDLGGVLVLNQKCVRNGQIDLAKGRRHDPKKRPVGGRLLAKGDVLVNSTGVGTLGRVAQVLTLKEDSIVDSHVTVVRANESLVSWNYLGVNLLRRQDEIESLGEGSTGQTELPRSRLASLPILLPARDVVGQFDRLVLPLRGLSVVRENQSRTLAALRDALLPKLISGEIQVFVSTNSVKYLE